LENLAEFSTVVVVVINWDGGESVETERWVEGVSAGVFDEWVGW